MRFWLLPLLFACHSKDGVSFPSTLAPLEANRAPPVAAAAGEPFPEDIRFASGKDDGRYWAHARAYVHGSVDEVFDALQRPAVLVDRREIDVWEVQWDTVPSYDVSLTLAQTVDDVITVSYDTTWVMEIQGADDAGITRLAAQWDKTDGTAFIDLLAGSLVVTAVAPDVSELSLVAWLEATLRDEQTLVSYERDLHADLVAAVRGEPLPTY